MKHAVSIMVALTTLCSVGSAQAPTPVDAGTLTSTSNTPMGVRTGTEEFTIVRNADGGFTMTSVTTEGRKMRTVLTTDSIGNPIAYEHHGQGGEAVEKTITSRRVEGSGAMVISESSTRNPPVAPFQFPANTFLFGDGGTAQVWFLGLGAIPRDVSYFWTGPWRPSVGRVSEIGRESITIDGSPIEASHLIFGGGMMPQRDFWLDSQKRLLKVSSSGGNSVAVRTKLPK